MMRAVEVIRHPNGPRVFIAGQRIHHGATGCALAVAALAIRQPALAVAALALVVHDRADWRVWFIRDAWVSVSKLTQDALDVTTPVA